MTTEQLTHAERSLLAGKAWAALPHGGRDAVRLQIHCGRGHHVAAVYATDAGLVYAAPVRPHSHGAHDLPDEPHGPQKVERWFDVLAAGTGLMVDDAMPAWCDCGHRVLSRAALLEWMGDGEHRVVID